MKKIQLGFAALLLTVSIAIAQPGQAKHFDRKHHRKEMDFKSLNLTDDQKDQMKTANDDFRTKMKALNSNENQTVKQQHEGRDALIKQHRTQVENILSTEQKAKLADMKLQAAKHHQKDGTKRIDKLKQELNLTDAQAAQLKSNQETNKAKIKAIRENNSLDGTAKKQQLKELEEDAKNSLEKILTPEQKTKWQGMKKEHMNRYRKFGERRFHTQSAV